MDPVAPHLNHTDIPPLPPLPPLFLPPTDPAPADAAAEEEIVEDAVAEESPAEVLVVETVADEPVVDDAIADEPVVDDPIVDEPVADEPVIDEPLVVEPVIDPVVDERVVVEPIVADEPVVVAEAAVEEPLDERLDVVDAAAIAEPIETATDSLAPALALRAVVKQFGRTRAVDAIDLTIPVGSFFGLVGPNGAGKTTTLSMIAGLLRPDSGTIEVCGVDTATDPSRAKKLIGVLPDRLRTFDRLTGRQLLYYYGVLRGLSASVVQSRIADLARAFDLVDALGRVVSDYSAGMTKKVMLAGAMIHSPRVLVLDEPFEALDPASSQVILDILETYVEHGGTVVLSSHGMALVERVCTRVAVLVEGEVLASGTVDEVRGEMTLEQRFVALSGGVDDAEGLEWLHTFSD